MISRTLAIAAATFATVAILGIKFGPSPISGDETQYYAMTYALATTGSPTLTPAVVDAVRTAFPGRSAAEPGSVKAVDGTYDALHFWFLSLLASPFFLLCKAVGLDWKHCFVFVNALAFALAVAITYRYIGLRAAGVFIMTLLASPLVAYLNKAHPEAFSVSLFAAAAVFVAQNMPLAAALVTAIIACQISAFSPLVAVLLLWWASRLWTERRRPVRMELVILAACGCLLALQPLWSLWRHHTLNLIIAQGYVVPEMATPRRIVGLLIDPDVGLLFTWPLGFVMGLMTLAGLWRSPDLISKHRAYWAFVIGAGAFLSYVAALQANYTASIPRYSLWFIPLCVVSFMLVYQRELEAKGTRRFATAIAIVCVAGSAASVYYYAAVVGFQPSLKRHPLAELWYRLLPAAYDPDEQVFADITLGEQRAGQPRLFFTGRYPINRLPDPHIWALSNESCTKLLVFAYAFTSSHVEPWLPFGCKQPLNARELLSYVRRSGDSSLRDRYVNLPERELDRMKLRALPTVPPAESNRPPHVESVEGTPRSSSEITYVLRVSDPDGWQDLDSTFFSIADRRAGNPLESQCYVVYNQPRDELRVATRTARRGAMGQDILTDPAIPGRPGTLHVRPDTVSDRSGTLHGAHCRINPRNVTVTAAGDTLTLTLPIVFDATLNTSEVTSQVGVTDLAQSTSGWSGDAGPEKIQRPPAVPPSDLTLVRVAEEGDMLRVTLHDASKDLLSITRLWVLVNDRLDLSGACFVLAELTTRTLYLTPDDGNTGRATPMSLDKPRFLKNSQCAIDGKNSSLLLRSDVLDLRLHVIRGMSFAAPKRVWAAYQDRRGIVRPWLEIGVW